MIRQFFRRTRVKRIAVVAALIGAALALGACDKDPVKPKIPPEPPKVYLDPISPQNVLQNLVYAYNHRDSVGTKAVYHYLYEGTSNDPSQPTPTYNFTRADEVQHVKRLHDDSSILSVSLDLGAPGSWQRQPGLVTDPPGTAIIPISYFRLSITATGGVAYDMKPVTMEFAFIPTVSAPGDTTWSVIRWTEAAQ